MYRGVDYVIHTNFCYVNTYHINDTTRLYHAQLYITRTCQSPVRTPDVTSFKVSRVIVNNVGATANQMTISGAAKCLFIVDWCFLGLVIYLIGVEEVVQVGVGCTYYIKLPENQYSYLS